MRLLDFYNRVLETSGLEVMTLGSLNAAIKNCMADLTSRGYKDFRELQLTAVSRNKNLYVADNSLAEYKKDYATYSSILTNHKDILIINAPTDIRKILYLKVFFKDMSVKALRYSLTNPRVQCTYDEGFYKSAITGSQCVYYIKNDKIYIEWDKSLGDIFDFMFGYYARIKAPDIPDTIEITEDSLANYEISIREEFEDALVFYSCYFYYARYMKDQDKLQFYINQYKYYVEDITHELSYEDDFYEEDAIIKLDNDI